MVKGERPHSRPRSAAPLVLAALLASCCAAAPAAADWLVFADGVRLETRGPWELKGRVVVFSLPNGLLSSVRVEQLDIAASLNASGRELPAPPPPTAARPPTEPPRPARQNPLPAAPPGTGSERKTSDGPLDAGGAKRPARPEPVEPPRPRPAPAQPQLVPDAPPPAVASAPEPPSSEEVVKPAKTSPASAESTAEDLEATPASPPPAPATDPTPLRPPPSRRPTTGSDEPLAALAVVFWERLPHPAGRGTLVLGTLANTGDNPVTAAAVSVTLLDPERRPLARCEALVAERRVPAGGEIPFSCAFPEVDDFDRVSFEVASDQLHYLPAE